MAKGWIYDPKWLIFIAIVVILLWLEQTLVMKEAWGGLSSIVSSVKSAMDVGGMYRTCKGNWGMCALNETMNKVRGSKKSLVGNWPLVNANQVPYNIKCPYNYGIRQKDLPFITAQLKNVKKPTDMDIGSKLNKAASCENMCWAAGVPGRVPWPFTWKMPGICVMPQIWK
jgi:hypothetical protein